MFVLFLWYRIDIELELEVRLALQKTEIEFLEETLFKERNVGNMHLQGSKCGCHCSYKEVFMLSPEKSFGL